MVEESWKNLKEILHYKSQYVSDRNLKPDNNNWKEVRIIKDVNSYIHGHQGKHNKRLHILRSGYGKRIHHPNIY